MIDELLDRGVRGLLLLRLVRLLEPLAMRVAVCVRANLRAGPRLTVPLLDELCGAGFDGAAVAVAVVEVAVVGVLTVCVAVDDDAEPGRH